MMRSLFDAPSMTVGELCRIIRSALRTRFPARVRVLGEISRATLNAGNLYFTLKDREGLIQCYCPRDVVDQLRLGMPPGDGLAVEVAGFVDTYPWRSTYQLRVSDIVPVGPGALHQAFERLKAQLQREGLFEAARKRPVPRFIRDVAIVTSRSGAAFQDFKTTARRRGAHVRIWLVHAPVSGAVAAPELARAIVAAGKLPVDVVVVARGGGSLEDLWAFNTEQVARAIAACRRPVISAVGHETDITIADFVADLRVATPTAAAEYVAQERAALLQRIAAARARLRRALVRRSQAALPAFNRMLRALERMGSDLIDARIQRYDDLALQLRRADPRRRIRVSRERARKTGLRLQTIGPRMLESRWELVDVLGRQLGVSFGALRSRRSRSLDVAVAQLEALAPRRTLERGYAIVYGETGEIVTESSAVGLGEKIAVELKSGSLGAKVVEKKDAHG
jgi:exodeoxyribonuclease VII large subunit